jgi:hypothetical protein
MAAPSRHRVDGRCPGLWSGYPLWVSQQTASPMWSTRRLHAFHGVSRGRVLRHTPGSVECRKLRSEGLEGALHTGVTYAFCN